LWQDQTTNQKKSEEPPPLKKREGLAVEHMKYSASESRVGKRWDRRKGNKKKRNQKTPPPNGKRGGQGLGTEENRVRRKWRGVFFQKKPRTKKPRAKEKDALKKKTPASEHGIESRKGGRGSSERKKRGTKPPPLVALATFENEGGAFGKGERFERLRRRAAGSRGEDSWESSS